MQRMILRADISGSAQGWLTWQEAVVLYATDKVKHTLGDPAFRIRGGTNGHTGEQSVMDLHPVIFTHGFSRHMMHGRRAVLSQRALFARDGHMCLYCQKQFHPDKLTRDHVLPVSRGGKTKWTNLASSCRRCNAHKANRTPEEAGMPLIAVPYEPCYEEFLLLTMYKRKHVVADQMDFLMARCPERPRLWM